MHSARWNHQIDLNNQRIGVAVADDPHGPWTRFDEPLIDVDDRHRSTRFGPQAVELALRVHELVGAVGAEGQEGAADEARPQDVGLGEREAEVDRAELAGGGGDDTQQDQ